MGVELKFHCGRCYEVETIVQLLLRRCSTELQLPQSSRFCSRYKADGKLLCAAHYSVMQMNVSV